MHFDINLATTSRHASTDLTDLAFGTIFADHMLSCRFEGGAWQTPASIVPYGSLSFPPAMSALHYGQSVFEGMKAYYKDPSTRMLFRVEDHYQRLAGSCERLSMPAPPRDVFIEGLKELVRIDHRWVPAKEGFSLYIRPLVFATDEVIAAKASETYQFMIITSPVGPYYKTGLKPVSLTTSPDYVRAVVGGTGEAKAAGNYAASFKPARIAQSKGFAQVLWLDAVHHRYVEEVGTMNLFFRFKDRLATPSLLGSVLPGITRRSIIELAGEKGLKVTEERLAIDELFEAYEAGELLEVFGSGTAAIVAPVGLIHHEGRSMSFDQKHAGTLAADMYKAVTEIQYGRVEDRHGWTTEVSV